MITEGIFQEYVNVNNDLSFDTIAPYERIVMGKYFTFLSMAAIDEINSFSGSGDPIEVKGYESMTGAICNFMLYEAIPFLEVQIGDGGITRIENESVKSAYAGQIKSLRNSLINNGYQLIDNLVDDMDTNPIIFTEWTSSPGSIKNSKLLIKTCRAFHAIIPLYRRFSTFSVLHPILAAQQKLTIETHTNSVLFAELLADVPDTPEKVELKSLLTNALCYYTMAESLRQGFVKVTSEGTRALFEDKDTAQQLEASPNLQGASTSYYSYMTQGRTYMKLAYDLISNSPTELGLDSPDPITQPKRFFA